jgi:hypothetical protein
LGDVIEPTLSVIAQGVKETELNGRTFTYGPGQFLVVSVELPVIGHVTHATVEEPILAVVLELRPERIAALLLETASASTARPGAVDVTPAGIAVSDASGALIDAIGRLLALLDAPDDAAALATMSVSSFHRHFRAVTSMTPIQYQKQIRLREARGTAPRPAGRHHRRRLRGRLRQPLAIQPRVPAHVRGASQPRRARASRGRGTRRRSGPPMTHDEPAIAHGPAGRLSAAQFAGDTSGGNDSERSVGRRV